jgi:uncharacterized protein DUF4184
VPYAFAHPAAVIPLARLLGGRAVPSALAIGSVIPDAWYFVPALTRESSHDLLGLLWFCLPAGLVAYAAFHLIFKQPMLALLPRRLGDRFGGWTCTGLPAASWWAVVVSMVLGIATHIAWDALTHEGVLADALALEQRTLQVLQHGSTFLGTAVLAAWLWRRLRVTTPRPCMRVLDPWVRITVLAAMALLPGIAFVNVVTAFDPESFRTALRAGGVTGVATLGFIALSFSLAYKRWMPQ